MGKYLGYEIRMEGGRYIVFGLDGVRIGSFDDATAARRWARVHSKAAGVARSLGGSSE